MWNVSHKQPHPDTYPNILALLSNFRFFDSEGIRVTKEVGVIPNYELRAANWLLGVPWDTHHGILSKELKETMKMMCLALL